MQSSSFSKNLIKGISKRVSKIFANPYRDLNIGTVTLKYLKHLPPGPLRQQKLGDGVVFYRNAQELLHGLKELYIDQIYKVDLPPDAYIIDCGANIGLSVIYLKKAYPGSKILAFEPDKTNYELLTKNINSFRLNNVTAVQEAVWIENTSISFASEGSMSSKIDTAAANLIQIKATRLKDHLNQKVHFLKIDIEGAEYVVLKDIKDELNYVDNLFIEYHGKFSQNKELLEILEIVQKNDFSFYIKEATSVFNQPFVEAKQKQEKDYDVQLNIFCFRL